MISMKRVLLSSFVLAAVILAAATFASAQRPPVPRPSQKASLSQTIGTTEVTITYSRPAVKGRKVYGDWPTAVTGEGTLDNQNERPKDAVLVPWGHVWRTGANEATLFVVTDDVLVNGQPLAAGKYSLHSIPGKDDWTFIFNKDDGQWGSFSYDAKNDALRVKAKPTWVSDSQELLAFTADPVSENAATFNVSWEKLRVGFSVEVKDVVGSTMTRLKAYVAAAKPDDPGPRITAGLYAKANKQNEQATAWFEDALKLNDAMIAAKETFQNLQRKATILLNLGRGTDALAAAERAVVVGKADPNIKAADIAALEKRIADLKAGKQ
jgi:hypothetical protein